MSSIGSSITTSATTSNNGTTVLKSQDVLGKDDFLKLLMTQMQNQDPTKPMDDTQSIAQLAQFSSLEQMQNLNTSMAKMTASSIIGDTIGFKDSNSNAIAGVVNGINIDGDTTNVVVGVDAVQYNQYLPSATSDLSHYPVGWKDDSKVSHTGVITSSKLDTYGVLQITATETATDGTTKSSTFASTQVTRLIVPTKIATTAITDITK